MDVQQLQTKIEITHTAVKLYAEDNFSMGSLIDKTGMTASEIYTLFPSKKAILEFYYPSLVIRYRAMIEDIEDFDSYSISEKLSNFIFTLFDMMEEEESFVQQTFERYACNPGAGRNFHKEIKSLFKDLIENDGRISGSASLVMGNLFYSFLKTQYLLLVKFWLQDDSEQKERTWALTDKITSFIEELAYSKIADKGFDLLKYALNTSGLKQQIHDLNNWVSSWIEEEPDIEIETEIEEEKEEEEENETNNISG